MSYQVFLQGKIVGTEQFLIANPEALVARSQWASLLSQVLPRAILAELALSPMLLGSSGGDQFLLVLPDELRSQAGEILRRADAHLDKLTSGLVRLVWAITENLGSWIDIRKRLRDETQLRLATPPSRGFEVLSDPASTAVDFFNALETDTIYWNLDKPALIDTSSGRHQWRLGTGPDHVPFIRHDAMDDVGDAPATPDVLAVRATGTKAWGVLVGDVDDISLRFQRAQSIEEHLQLSVMYRQFFAGELQMICSQPEFFRKLTLLHTGADDFALYGSWDALIAVARELHRLFSLFVEANLREHAGLEGKTISMGLSLSRPEEDNLGAVYMNAKERLEAAKSSGKDCIHIFGRTIAWKQLAEAAESRQTMTALVRQGAAPEFLSEIADFYRESAHVNTTGARGRADRLDRPWRFYRRLNSYLGELRGKESQRLRADLIDDFTGRRAKQIRLRPQERVALEWAHLEIEQA